MCVYYCLNVSTECVYFDHLSSSSSVFFIFSCHSLRRHYLHLREEEGISFSGGILSATTLQIYGWTLFSAWSLFYSLCVAEKKVLISTSMRSLSETEDVGEILRVSKFELRILLDESGTSYLA